MTKKEAIKILGLNEDFTLRELEKRYGELETFIDFHRYGAKKADIEKAYRFLKDKKLYKPFVAPSYSLDDIDYISVELHLLDRKLTEELQFLNNKFNLLKETSIENISIFIEREELPLENDGQISMFSYPSYLAEFIKTISEKAKETINQIEAFEGLTSYPDFEKIVINFKNFILEKYMEILLEYLKVNGYSRVDAQKVYNKFVLSERINFIKIEEFYQRMVTFISRISNEFLTSLKSFLKSLSYEHHYGNPDTFDFINFDEVEKEVMEVFKSSLILDDSTKREVSALYKKKFSERVHSFSEIVNFLQNSIERKRKEVRKLPGSIVFESELENKFSEIFLKYRGINFIHNSEMCEEVQSLIDKKIDEVLSKYKKHIELLNALAKTHPEMSNEELLKLTKQVSDEGILNLTSDDKEEEGSVVVPVLGADLNSSITTGFLVYQGDNLSFSQIEDRLKSQISDGYRLKGISIKNNLLTKIVPKGKSNIEPYADCDGLVANWFLLSEYDKTEMDEVYKKFSKGEFDASGEKNHRILSYLYRNYGLQMIDLIKDLISISIVIYDPKFDELNVAICRKENGSNRLFMGYIENDNNGVLYSDSLDVIRCFCEEIYELSPNSYVTNKVPNSLTKYDTGLRFRF